MTTIALPGTIIALVLVALLALIAGAVIVAVGRVIDRRSSVGSGEDATLGDDQTKSFDPSDLQQRTSGWTDSRSRSERMPLAA